MTHADPDAPTNGTTTVSPPTDGSAETSGRSGLDELTVLNLLIRDTLALRQRLFSYLQFYLTAQAGLAVLFGFVLHDSYDVLQLPSARIGLVLSSFGLLASFLVIAYGLFSLRPGKNSSSWIADQTERSGSFADVERWAGACRRRLEQLLSANQILNTKVTRIRIGLMIQLVCGLILFLLALRF